MKIIGLTTKQTYYTYIRYCKILQVSHLLLSRDFKYSSVASSERLERVFLKKFKKNKGFKKNLVIHIQTRLKLQVFIDG